MFKKWLVFLALLTLTPAFAEGLNSAFAQKDNVVVYLYSASCKYCDRFNPIYEQVSQKYSNDYKFVKISVDTHSGMVLLHKTFQASYVPYVIMLNQKKNKQEQITSDCLTQKACVEKELIQFKK